LSAPPADPLLSVVLLAKDEEENLPRTLESLAGLPADVFVVDSGSTDGTRALAEGRGAAVHEHPFESHALQWRWALEHLPLRTPWVLGLDADQRLAAGLGAEIAEVLRSPAAGGTAGWFVRRVQVFRGREIRWGGYGGKRLLKLFRRDAVVLDGKDSVDHRFWVRGRTAHLRHPIVEENRKEEDLEFFLRKHAAYAKRQAGEEAAGGRRWPVEPSLFGTPDQRSAWRKERWSGLPLYVRPTLYFLYRYVLLLGFLDGRQGFLFHFLQAYWYRVLVDAHLDGMRRRATENG
jgi:glycosyltransferase involved in cell wall biosynthesis